MTIVAEILKSWRDPRGVLRARLDGGVREDRALATLMGACGLIFVGQLPRLAREAAMTPDIPFEARLGAALVGIVFLFPLVAYLLAGISHLVARAFGGKGSGFAARMALFWALLAASPAFLLHGLGQGLWGQGPVVMALGAVSLAGFLYLWGAMLFEAER